MAFLQQHTIRNRPSGHSTHSFKIPPPKVKKALFKICKKYGILKIVTYWLNKI